MERYDRDDRKGDPMEAVERLVNTILRRRARIGHAPEAWERYGAGGERALREAA